MWLLEPERFCGCRSFQVLSGNIDSIVLGMPGSALSDSILSDADMPRVEEMVNDSLESCCIFKRQAPVPQPAAQPPFPNQGAAEDPLQDMDAGQRERMLMALSLELLHLTTVHTLLAHVLQHVGHTWLSPPCALTADLLQHI